MLTVFFYMSSFLHSRSNDPKGKTDISLVLSSAWHSNICNRHHHPNIWLHTSNLKYFGTFWLKSVIQCDVYSWKLSKNTWRTKHSFLSHCMFPMFSWLDCFPPAGQTQMRTAYCPQRERDTRWVFRQLFIQCGFCADECDATWCSLLSVARFQAKCQ